MPAEFDVTCEMTVVSAHRTPVLADYAKAARDRVGHLLLTLAAQRDLLSMVAAMIATLPVIGVPVGNTKLSGLDSLLSIVQMPRGVPVATVAIDNARNAGLLAVQIHRCRTNRWQPPRNVPGKPDRPCHGHGWSGRATQRLVDAADGSLAERGVPKSVNGRHAIERVRKCQRQRFRLDFYIGEKRACACSSDRRATAPVRYQPSPCMCFRYPCRRQPARCSYARQSQ